MVLTHNVKTEVYTDKKTKFDRFKDYLKEKTFLFAVPLVLTFTTPCYAEDTSVKYKHEDVDKELTINVTKNMKKSYLDYEKGKINQKQLESILFKEVYAQVKNKDFPMTKLSDVVYELILNLEDMKLSSVPVKSIKKTKKKIAPKKEKEEVSEVKEEYTIPQEKVPEFTEFFAWNLSLLEKESRSMEEPVVETPEKVEKPINEDEKLKVLDELYEIRKTEIATIDNTKLEDKKPDRTRVQISLESDFTTTKNTLPGLNDSGVINDILNSDLKLKIITKSKLGIDFSAGFSGELVSFMESIHDSRDPDSMASNYYEANNYLARMLGGLSYNSDSISFGIMGGYKLGKLYSTDELKRNGYYPIITGNLESNNKQFTRLKFEIPILFNEGQNLAGSFEHASKYIVISTNVNYSRQSEIITDYDYVLKNTYKILNSVDFIGLNIPIKYDEGFISPTLYVVGNVNYLNANDLQKMINWSVGPGLGLNVIHKEVPIFSLGYGYGLGKSYVKYTDLANANDFILKSPYSTHNVLIRVNTPLTENFRVYSELTYVRGDGKGADGIKSPMSDYAKFLLLLSYIY